MGIYMINRPIVLCNQYCYFEYFGPQNEQYYTHFWWKPNCMLCCLFWIIDQTPQLIVVSKKGEHQASEAWIEKIPFHGNVQWSIRKKEVQ